MSYKGWPNYETSLVDDWVSECPEMYRQVRKQCRQEKFHAEAADKLKTIIHGMIPDLKEEDADQALFLNFIRGGLAEVDWLELAQTYRQDS